MLFALTVKINSKIDFFEKLCDLITIELKNFISMNTENLDISNLSFEEALAKLEENVKLLEDGNLPLDKAVEIFELGNKLQAHCKAKLSEAKLKIEKVIQSGQQDNLSFEEINFQ